MNDNSKTKAELIEELQKLRPLLDEKTNIDLNSQDSKYIKLFEHANDAIFIFDTDSIFIDCNNRACILLGYKKEEIIGKPVIFFSNEFQNNGKKSETLIPLINEKAFNGEAQEFEWEFLNKNGNVIPILVSLSIFTDNNQQYMYGIVRDLTKEKKAQKALKESEERFKAFMDNTPVFAYIKDKNLNHIYNNKSTHKIHNKPDNEQVTDSDFFDDAILKFINKHDEIIFSGKSNYEEIEYSANFHNQDIILRDIKFPIDIPGKEKLLGGVALNITEEKKAEKKLRESEEMTRMLLNAITESFILIDRDYKIMFINENGAMRLGKKSESIIGSYLFDYFSKELSEIRKKSIDKVFKTEKTFTFEDQRDSYHFYNQLYLIKNHDRKNDKVAIFAVDISELKYTEQALKESDQRFKAFMDYTPVYAYIKDKNLKHVYENTTTKSLLDNHNTEENDSSSFFDEDITKMIEDADIRILNGKSNYEELEFLAPLKGKNTWLKDIKFPIEIPGKGKFIGGVAIDITEEKKAEKKILKSLQEKEVLLAEIHDRVKNNLQIISSLIKMQTDDIDDDVIKSHLNTTASRIKTMGILHNKLYQSNDFSNIDIKEYIISLLSQIDSVFNTLNKKINYDIEIDNVYLNIDTAIPCGLIINEVITNSIKFAYPGKDKGDIGISIRANDDKIFTMKIFDKGMGFPDNIKEKKLGLQLIEILVAQLQGSVKIIDNNGITYEIIFKMIKENRNT